MVNWREHIVSDPGVMFGKPCIAGTRVPVSHVLDKLAAGISIQQLLCDYPRITRDDVLSALAFAAEALEDAEVTPTGAAG